MDKRLSEIQYNIAKADITDGRVQNLASYINVDLLEEIHYSMDKNKAAGVDKVTKDEYGKNLEVNLMNLVARMKSGRYRPNPSRRVYIPKEGKAAMRPLGISCYEDKLVENAIARILMPIYEPQFYDMSYGFRPRRNCHQAIRKLIRAIQSDLTSYVVEADIRGFFDNVDHEWLIKMLEHDIADRKFIDLIRKFLKAGIMENGKYLDSETGTPQGNGASPILANVYLHYVLDNWFDVVVQRWCRGRCHLIRYADDFVCCFQYKAEAEEFRRALEVHMRKYGLELAEDKTRILEFGRFAVTDRKSRGQGKPETFDFLGFTFYCSTDRQKKFFRCKVMSSAKRMRTKLKAMNKWIKDNRNMRLDQLIKRINDRLRGYYQYYCVTDNIKRVVRFYDSTQDFLFKWLNRRSQRRSYTWDTFANGLLRTYPLIRPKIKVNLYLRDMC
ncbi:MAG: group II intron reverse transcriptase/maturase [Lachnospiraceae bacterium]|nr:group II intron reverse transcriptase/maturase [Lachnospiraceae bacterium]